MECGAAEMWGLCHLHLLQKKADRVSAEQKRTRHPQLEALCEVGHPKPGAGDSRAWRDVGETPGMGTLWPWEGAGEPGDTVALGILQPQGHCSPREGSRGHCGPGEGAGEPETLQPRGQCSPREGAGDTVALGRGLCEKGGCSLHPAVC